MDFEDISLTKDFPPTLTDSRNYSERYSTSHGGQVDLQEIELIQPNTVYGSYPNTADTQYQLHGSLEADENSTAVPDDDCHAMLISDGQLGVPNLENISSKRNQIVTINCDSASDFGHSCFKENTVKQSSLKESVRICESDSRRNIACNVTSVTESSYSAHICCNTSNKNDMNSDETFVCGVCKIIFSTICQLHCHLKSKHSPEKYIFYLSMGTAFLEPDKECRNTQTDFRDLIEYDEDNYNEETDCSGDNVIEGCSVDSDQSNRGISDVSNDVASCPNYSSKSQIKRSHDRHNLKQKKRARIHCKTSPQVVNNSGVKVKKTRDNEAILRTVTETTDMLDNNDDEKSDNSSNQTYKLRSGKPADFELSSGKLASLEDKNESTRNIIKNVRRKATRKKKLRTTKNSVSSDTKAQHGTVTEAVESDHESSSVYQCEQCNTKYPSMSRLRYHIMKVHSKICDTTLRQCRWCRQTLQGIKSYLAHTRQCDRNENLICFICDKSFTTKSKVFDHLMSHRNAQDYICKLCQKVFPNELSLQHHLRRHNQRKNIQCEHCGKGFFYQYLLTRHLGYCNKDPEINCDQCEMKFKTQRALDHHKIVHSNDRPYVCHICGYAVKKSAYLTRHIRSHTGERPYSCSDCGVKFTALTGLNRHKKIHTNNKPYVCTYCEKSFTTNWNLKTHLRQHTGDTPYKCDLCGKAFKQNVLLKLHWKSHHP